MLRKVMKFISLMLFVTLGVFTLSANANNESESKGKISSADLYNEPGVLPIVKEPITLTVFAPAQGEDSWADNLQTKELEEKTGIKIDWKVAPSQDNIQTKISTLFASGEVADIILTGVSSKSRYNKAGEQSFANQGLILKLNDYIDNVSVGYKEAFENVEGMKDFITMPDGGIYSLPNLDGSLHVQYNMKLWINTKWLDNLGLEMPKTTAEFEAVLLAFKEKDANGNGNPNDEIPFSTVTKGAGVQLDGFLMAPFQMTPESSKLLLENGKVIYAPVQDKYKAGLKWLNGMYEKGLIYPESFTQDKRAQININEAGEDAVIGCFVSQRPGYANDLKTYPNNSKRWEEYASLPPLEGPDGTRQAAWNPYTQFQTGMVFISSSCKYPEAAFRLIDYLATKEATMRSVLGVEGVDWEAAAEGELGLDGKQAIYKTIDVDTDRTNFKWGQTLGGVVRTSADTNGQVTNQDPFAEGVRPLDGRQVLMYKGALDHQAVRQEFDTILPDLYMSQEDAAEMALLKTEVEEAQKNYMTEFIIGTMDLDADWDSYIKKLERSGLTEYLELLQKAYDESIYSK